MCHQRLDSIAGLTSAILGIANVIVSGCRTNPTLFVLSAAENCVHGADDSRTLGVTVPRGT